MRTQLAALGGVEATFKQRAKNRHVNGRPVQRGGIAQHGHVHDVQCWNINVFEQATVKPVNVMHTKQITIVHGVKQRIQTTGQLFAGQRAILSQQVELGVDHFFKQTIRQQAHVFSEKTKQALG